MRYHPIDNNLFKNNRKRLIEQLPTGSIAVFHSNDQYPRNGDQYFPYRQQSDFFYLTGIDQEKSILILAPDCDNKKLNTALFLLETSEQLAIYEGHKYTKEEAADISGIENVYWESDFEVSLREVLANAKSVYLNANEYIKFSSEVSDKNHRFTTKFKSDYPLYKVERAAPILAKLRTIKRKEEIRLMQEACDITQKAFERVLRFTKPGVREYEIQAEIDHEFTINRSGGHGYAPIVASGKNACVLHYIKNEEVCRDGDLLLMDFGAEYANYSADLSRTIPVNGKFTPRQKDCYNAVLRVFKEAKKLLVPGNTSVKVGEETNKLMEAEMIKLGLFTAEDVKNQDPQKPLFKNYFMHGTSHFLGLDVHDVGMKDEPFKPGMVLTCEPGLYIPEEKMGIRIENDILITEKDPVDLMKNIPIEVDEIEHMMKNQ